MIVDLIVSIRKTKISRKVPTRKDLVQSLRFDEKINTGLIQIGRLKINLFDGIRPIRHQENPALTHRAIWFRPVGVYCLLKFVYCQLLQNSEFVNHHS